MSDEQNVDDLLRNFQRACEDAIAIPDFLSDARRTALKERAIFRNELRARLLAASVPSHRVEEGET